MKHKEQSQYTPAQVKTLLQMTILYSLLLDWEVSVTGAFTLILGNIASRWKIISYTVYLIYNTKSRYK